MSNTALDIHRLLDEAFVGIEVTPEVQDLKEEMRANLVARVEELQASGVAPGEAARRAIAELGDVRAIVDETVRVAGDAPSWQRHRVRPRPAYVMRTVLVALVAAAALGFVVLRLAGLVGAEDQSTLDVAAAIAVAALAGGFLVGDGLRQETTTNHPVSRRRAVGYGVATTAGLVGLGSVAGYVLDRALAWPIAGVVLLVVSIVIFTYLGTTQTNRHKPWVVREMARHERAADRFERDPAAAARFGIYTVAIWIVALAAFVVVGFTVGWAWSLLALLGGVVVMMLTLARMLFGGDARQA
ncbi:MAG: hypothetical protein IRY85_16855 [Micromonosporaceae bacterium]|nr:hypothetical protein [Micromonosporaceae bacterium]